MGSDRKFGLAVGAILCVLAFAPLLHHRPVRLWLIVPGALLILLGVIAPALLGPLNGMWFRFGLLLGRITNPIVMGVLFYAVMVPMGWLLRLRGNDLLSLRRDPAADSYWVHRDATSASTSLKNQF